MKILITGVAGFIGSFTAKSLLKEGHEVIGVDNLNDYYDVSLKQDRLNWLSDYANFQFIQVELADTQAVVQLFASHAFERVIHLAAQAGVRYSLTHPHAYAQSNFVAFVNILEGCRNQNCTHLVYASSSSVYGLNQAIPYQTDARVDHPVSLYAATKKSNELMAHTYSHLYGIPTTGLRFFTVYGPWGRPDMAYFSFTKAILGNQSIRVFNQGNMQRDFTYIDDIVFGINKVMNCIPKANPDWNSEQGKASQSSAPYKIFNIGNHNTVKLGDFIATLESLLGREAKKEYVEMQKGDVQKTYADVDDLIQATGFAPNTDLKTGLDQFVNWYLNYYKVG